jgi:uncharacterized protein (DUF2236 family)
MAAHEGPRPDRHALAEPDLERLRAATGRPRIDPAASVFRPDSISWRVNREGVLVLGGGRALLMQVAHPLVAAGVAAHSRFRAEPLRRLWRTLDSMLTIVFGDGAEAIAVVRRIEGVHARVRGVLDVDVGPFPRGTRYDASDPELLFWVHATLVDTALVVFERFIAPLDAGVRAAYYEESKVIARLFGIPERLVPKDMAAFERYLAAALAGDTLTIGPQGRDVAETILHPPVTPPLGALLAAARPLTVGLLPPVLRQRYGLGWSPLSERLLAATASVSRGVTPVMPGLVRFMPHARRAAR